jgi:hypothetical protein
MTIRRRMLVSLREGKRSRQRSDRWVVTLTHHRGCSCSMRLMKTVFLTMAALVIGLMLYGYILHAMTALSCSFQIDFGEGFILDSAARLAAGERLYPPMEGASLHPSLYPPLYYSLYALLIRGGGMSFAWGRLISLVSTIVAAFLLFSITRRMTGKALLAGAAPLLFLFSPTVMEWGVLARVDMLALFFTLLGIFALASGSDRKSYGAAALWFTLALFTKQSFVAAPIAAFLSLFLNNQKKKALEFLVFYCSLCLIFFGAAEALSQGQFFIQALRNMAAMHYSAGRALYLGGIFIQDSLLILILALFYTIQSLWRRALTFLPLYFLLSLIVSLILAGKAGSYLNYYIEASAAASILAILQCAEGFSSNGRSRAVSVITRALAYLIPVAFMILNFHVCSEFKEADRILLKRTPEVALLSEIIRDADGRVMSEDAGLLVLNGKGSDVKEFLYLKELSRAGLWDQSGLLDDIEKMRFSLIVLNSELNEYAPSPRAEEHFNPEIIGAMKRHYELARRLCREGDHYHYCLYVPRRR